MLQIVFLIVSTGAIAAYARTRGGSPWLWGTLSVIGFLLIQFCGAILLRAVGVALDADTGWILLAMSFAWVGGIAICARFLLGMGRPKPGGMWSCTNCNYLNQHYAVICEACSKPYATKA